TRGKDLQNLHNSKALPDQAKAVLITPHHFPACKFAASFAEMNALAAKLLHPSARPDHPLYKFEPVVLGSALLPNSWIGSDKVYDLTFVYPYSLPIQHMIKALKKFKIKLNKFDFLFALRHKWGMLVFLLNQNRSEIIKLETVDHI